MTMIQMPQMFDDMPQGVAHIDSIDSIEHHDEIGKRFIESFTDFIQRKKRVVVEQVLADEFPHLASDESFIHKVIQNMGDDVVEEKRYVFLAVNPKYKESEQQV